MVDMGIILNIPIFKQSLILMVAIWVIALLLRKIGMPTIIGELLAGILIGPAVLGLIEPNESIDTLAQLGRKTGDRAMDADETLIDQLIDKLKQHNQEKNYMQMLTEPTLRTQTEQKQAFGESLPEGLILNRQSEE